MAKKIVGLVGSYRRGGAVDTLVGEVLEGARELGAETTKVYLLDKHIEFCTNCRACTQEPGSEPGKCIHDDDLRDLLFLLDGADGLVLGAPTNFYNVNALFRRFMERLVCLGYWPWESRGGPKFRRKVGQRRAVLVTSAGMPGFLIPVATGALRALKATATTMGVRSVARVYTGLMGELPQPVVPERALRKARAAGRRLVQG
jgi:multimeric flavodoxin WrbA